MRLLPLVLVACLATDADTGHHRQTEAYTTQGYDAVGGVGAFSDAVAVCDPGDTVAAGSCFVNDDRAEVVLTMARAVGVGDAGSEGWRCVFVNVGWTGDDLTANAQAHCVGGK